MDTYRTLDRILVTEKGTRLSETENRYQFRVDVRATKADIKQAVEQAFKVHVVKINTMNRKGKRKRERTQRYGRTARWKKAVVALKPGDTIDLT